MKKLVFAMVAMMAMGLVSCFDKTETTEAQTDSVTVENTVDSLAAVEGDSATAKDEVKPDEAKTEEAKGAEAKTDEAKAGEVKAEAAEEVKK